MGDKQVVVINIDVKKRFIMSTRLRNTIRFEVLKETILFKDRSFSLENP